MRLTEKLEVFKGYTIAGLLALAGAGIYIANSNTENSESIDSKKIQEIAEANQTSNNLKHYNSYVVNLNVERNGFSSEHSTVIQSGSTTEAINEWQINPTTISVRLIALEHRLGSGYGNSTSIAGLTEWQNEIESLSSRSQNSFYEPFAKEIHKVLKEARALQREVDLLLRVLSGIRSYQYIDDQWSDPSRGISEFPFVLFQGAKTGRQTLYDNQVDAKASTIHTLSTWSSLEENNENKSAAEQIAKQLSLTVWRYTDSDIDRVDKLIEKIGELEKKLTLDTSLLNDRDVDKQVLSSLARDIHSKFYVNFVVSLLEISRLAWALSPTPAPSSYWATSESDINPIYNFVPLDRIYQDYDTRLDLEELPYLKKGIDARLPKLPTDTLVTLRIPADGFLGFYNPMHFMKDRVLGSYDVDDGPISGETEIELSDPASMRQEVLGLEESGYDALGKKLFSYNNLVIHAAAKEGGFDGQLTIRDVLDKTPSDINSPWLTRYQHNQTSSIKLMIKPEGEVCNDPACFPIEEKQSPEYQAPPIIAVAASSFPATPLPNEVATLGFRLQNMGDITASAATFKLRLIDSATGDVPDDLTIENQFCQAALNGFIACDFGDMAAGAIADVSVTAKTPANGLFMWTGNLSSKGDLGGLRKRIGTLGELTKPEILAVVVIDKQTAFEDGIPVNPYPFGPSGDGDVTRNLFVVGKRLPNTKEEVSLKDGGKVQHFFQAFDDTSDPDHQALIEKGWMKYFDVDEPAEARRLAEKAELRGMLVDARLGKEVMPGKQTLNLNGTNGYWNLQFGDITATLHFVRYIENEPFDLLNNAYAPGRVYLAVQTNQTLPADSITLRLDLSMNGLSGAKSQKVIAKRTTYLGKNIYLSDPLDIHQANAKPSLERGVAVPVQFDNNKSVQIAASIDNSFIANSFLLATPVAKANIRVWSSPASQDVSFLWRDALRKTAVCHSNIDQINSDTIGASEAKKLWNLIILTTSEHFPEQSVKFGQHAATLLLRDTYLKLATEQNAKYKKILTNDEAIKGFISALRPRIYDRTIPVLRMKVPQLGGGEHEYRYAIMSDSDWLAKTYNRSIEEVEAYKKRATVAAIKKMIAHADDAIEQASELENCDVEGLVKLTGFSFEPIARVLKSELVTLEQTKLSNGAQNIMWSSDTRARFWVDQVAPLAQAVRTQQKQADIDTDLSLAIVSFLAMPLMLTENAAVTFVAFGIDLLDFGVTTVSEIRQYIDSKEELVFSKGAAVLIGEERYKEAQANAKAWYATAFAISVSAFGAMSGAIDTVPKVIKMRRVARGRLTTSELRTALDIDVLSSAQKQDFTAFAMSAHMRRTEFGLDQLAASERRAIDLVDQYASLRMPTRIEPKMDLPPSKLTESFQPRDPIQFELIESSGVRKFDAETIDPATPARPADFGSNAPSMPNPNRPFGIDPDASSMPIAGRATMASPPGGRIESVTFSDSLPNQLSNRVQDDTVVKAIDPVKGDIEIELGARVGTPGSTSEAFALPEDPENFVVRITYLRQGSSAVKLDEFGENVLRNRIKSEHIRAVDIREDYKAAAGRMRPGEADSAPSPAVRVTVAERVEPAYITLRKQAENLAQAINDGQQTINGLPIRRTNMSAAQMQAYDGALRDLNAGGYVWLDNKPDNFAFVKLEDGSGRVQVVVIDPGGIVPVRQSVADFLGISKAELARQIQLRVNGNFETYIPEFAYMKDLDNRSLCRYQTIVEQYGDAIDLEAIGMDDIDKLWFNPLSGEMFDYVSPMFEAAN